MATRGIQVSCRVRHDTCPESLSPCVNVDVSARRVVVHPSTSLVDSNVSVGDSGTAYSCFDGVYSSQSTQEEVFESVGRPFVVDLLAGYNCTIIAYGQTGSGKTYTVVGGQTIETQGLIPRAMAAIFEEIARIDPAEYEVSLTASFVEIYQEKLRDLLLPNSSRILRLREDKDRNVRIEGASEITVSSVATGMAILSRGNGQRSTGSTLMNANSSRSHSVLILTLTKKHLTSGTKLRGKMSIVDLAGSEKVQKTAAAGVRMEEAKLRGKMSIVDLAGSEKVQKTAAAGVRMEEAKHINRSLSALGNVINALTDEKAKHIPYRDSKLTRLLQTSLGGNAKTHLLLTCSSSINHLEETLSTLRFGSRAKNIQNKPHVNNENAGAGVEYGELLTSLQIKIENLHSYIRQLEMSPCKFCGSGFKIDTKECEATIDVALDPVTPEKDTTTDTNDSIVDDVMRAEMQSLRKALTTLMHDHETQEHAHNVARSMMKVTEQQLDSRHRSQEQTIQQQELALQDASSMISRVEKKLETLEDTARVLSTELHRLRGQQHQQQAGENAETEILRRQLDTSTMLAKQLEAKLMASRQGQEEMVDLRERLINKEHELSSLRCEVELLRSKKLPVTLPTAIAPGLSSPPRVPHTRPVTAVDVKVLASTSSSSRGDSKYGMSNIQNWWAGSVDEPARNQDETPEKHLEHVLSSSPTASKVFSGVKDEYLKRGHVLPPADYVNRVCNSASSATRPFRSRLVGLLNSLEEETTAYRELVVETKERTASRSGGRPRLPGLDTNLPSP